MNYKILDCTLRDGGYYTNWDFNKELIKQYLTNINKLPVEYLEVGYRSVEKDEYFGEYFYLPSSTIKNIKRYTSKKLSIMLNAKDCIDVDLKILLDDIKDDVSLVRIATDPNNIVLSLKLANELKYLGFNVSLNIMYISKIDDYHDFFDYLEDIEQYIDYLFLVDSYGSMYPYELEKFIRKIKKKTDITLGFHGHNNLELAFINTLTALNNGVDMIDCTVLGMGRGAGNLKTELILMYLKSKFNNDIDLNILGKLTETFQTLLNKYMWGTNIAYMVSGSYSLPQKDVMDALEIDRYSLSGIINQIKHDEDHVLPKFHYNGNVFNCIIIGGGESVKNNIEVIKEYLLQNKNILIIHSTSKYINLFEDIVNVQLCAVAGDELLKIDYLSNNISSYILEPTPRIINNKKQSRDNFFELSAITFIEKYFDSPLTISLQIALDIKSKEIQIIGFDGYPDIKTKKELYLMHENQEIINSFVENKEILSLTPTKYKNMIQKSIYAKILK